MHLLVSELYIISVAFKTPDLSRRDNNPSPKYHSINAMKENIDFMKENVDFFFLKAPLKGQ